MWLYGTLLAVKLALAAVFAVCLYAAVGGGADPVQPLFDDILLKFWVLPMLAVGAFALMLRDHQYRCRTCTRRLRMPLDRGSYAALLLNEPAIEYVCPYGHGRLTIRPKLGRGTSRVWQPYGSMWQELQARPSDPSGTTRDGQPF